MAQIKWVKIYTAADETSAAMIKERLEKEGIRVWVRVMLGPLAVKAFNTPRDIYIDSGGKEKARKIITELESLGF